ncbi:MAG: tRNA (adenine(22)-N(1))-methyltransferase [Lachnospiraceae bacterium]|jgi:tRNA (adenine22-N1)-methyltransferase
MEEISKRLQIAAALAAGGFIPGGRRFVADIGTDHAKLPVYMIQNRMADRALALDVRTGPLERAESRVREAGLTDKIECRLSDGFSAVARGEADVYVICGMGGKLIEKILTAGKEKLTPADRIVAGPQQDVPDFRAFVMTNGWQIAAERMLGENGKFYNLFLIELSRAEDLRPFSAVELRYGRELLESRDPVLYRALLREKRLDEKISGELAGHGGAGAARRTAQLAQNRKALEQALAYYR